MTIWCPGGMGNMSRGGGHLNACPGGLEGIIEAWSRGEVNNIEACPGGGTKQMLVQGAFTSLSRGGGDIIYACPLYIVPGGTFAIISSVG